MGLPTKRSGRLFMTRHALIIDDNSENLEVLSLLLKREGIAPIVLKSPREMSAAVNGSTQVDVVFLDLEFPNHSGLDLITELKKETRLKGIPIVAYSVHTSEVAEARAAGFDGFIGKPLVVDRFPSQIRQIL